LRPELMKGFFGMEKMSLSEWKINDTLSPIFLALAE